jgi:hypothetical protein
VGPWPVTTGSPPCGHTCLEAAGDEAAAAEMYRTAARLATNAREQRFLALRASRLG